MPSDSPLDACLTATAEPRARYRAAMAAAGEQIAAWLDAHRARHGDAADAALAALGPFARGRIDATRFASVVAGPRALAPEAVALAERAEAVLTALLARGDAPFVCDLPAGGDLRVAVRDALAETGRAFGAALVFQAVRTGVYRTEQHASLLDAFPFARWNRGERLLAPPLVVTLDGADLHADLLAEFLDGRQKIVLVVRGAATPAPLVRLLTPGTFVAQAAEAAVVARAAAFDGPAIVALVPATAARFVHDPSAGATLRERLTLDALPAEPALAAVGGRSAAQQREELAQLAQLAQLAAPVVSSEPVPAVPVVPVDGAEVDALASWLLAQAGLAGAGGTPS